jgi:hypothetical protein
MRRRSLRLRRNRAGGGRIAARSVGSRRVARCRAGSVCCSLAGLSFLAALHGRRLGALPPGCLVVGKASPASPPATALPPAGKAHLPVATADTTAALQHFRDAPAHNPCICATRPRASHDRHEPLISRDSRAAANPQSFLVDVNRVGSAFRPSLGTLLRQAGRAPGDSLRSAQQDNAPGQRRGLHAEQLLDLSNEILKLIDLKGAVDQAALEVGIENNDPAGPITVDLVHNAR